jgi:hypothetical protein
MTTLKQMTSAGGHARWKGISKAERKAMMTEIAKLPRKKRGKKKLLT